MHKESMSIELASLGKAIGAFYDFWKQFKGKKIKVLVDNYSLGGGHLERQLWTTIITGVIESVQEYPAGLILGEVEKEEIVTRQKIEAGSGIIETPPYTAISTPFVVKKTQINRLFVSFNTIKEIEWIG
jgi:hypothetical protein